MSAATPSSDPREYVLYLDLWARAMSQAMGEIAGASFACVFLKDRPSEAAPAEPADLWIVAGCSGALRGEMSLRLAPATTVRLAQILVNEPATPTEVTSEHREAALELLRQVSGLAAAELRASRGEVQLHLEAPDAAPSWPASFSGWFRVGEETPPLLIEVQLSAALLASLHAGVAEANAASTESDLRTAAATLSPHDERINLDLLMDVELDLTLRFGSRRMLLRELLDLNPGSVIALDRYIQEPVEVLLDGRLVARGEVVVAAGNYALRVTEIGPAGG